MMSIPRIVVLAFLDILHGDASLMGWLMGVTGAGFISLLGTASNDLTSGLFLLAVYRMAWSAASGKCSEPGAFAQRPDLARQPLGAEALRGGARQAAERVAVEVDDVRVDHEALAEVTQRVG